VAPDDSVNSSSSEFTASFEYTVPTKLLLHYISFSYFYFRLVVVVSLLLLLGIIYVCIYSSSIPIGDDILALVSIWFPVDSYQLQRLCKAGNK
jgi:hypothetical protein